MVAFSNHTHGLFGYWPAVLQAPLHQRGSTFWGRGRLARDGFPKAPMGKKPRILSYACKEGKR